MMLGMRKQLISIDGLSFSEVSVVEGYYAKNQTEHIFPLDYSAFLSKFDGVSGYFGYINIYGAATCRHTNVNSWNDFETWKFAWGNKLSSYFCIAGDVFGGQYAYRIENGSIDGKIYMLDALEMEVQFIFECFDEFLEAEFIRISREPYDPIMISAYRKFGNLDTHRQLIYSPSLHLGGEEDISNLIELKSETAMIFNGEIYTQMLSAPEGAVIENVEPYFDQFGRARIKLKFI